MQKTNVDRTKIKLVNDAVTLCKKLPNDAELGRELRKIITNHSAITFFGTPKASNKKTGI